MKAQIGLPVVEKIYGIYHRKHLLGVIRHDIIGGRLFYRRTGHSI